MVIAVVGLMMFMMKVTAKENSSNQTPRDNEADNNEDDDVKM